MEIETDTKADTEKEKKKKSNDNEISFHISTHIKYYLTIDLNIKFLRIPMIVRIPFVHSIQRHKHTDEIHKVYHQSI